MAGTFIIFPQTELTFYLFDEEVDAKMAKKLVKLGLADFEVKFPEDPNDKFVRGNGNLWNGGDFPQDGVPVTAATDSSKFSTVFNKQSNSISVYLEGRFFSYREFDQSYADRSLGYVDAIRLNNEKGKLIKKPKDEWGVAAPIEALAEKGVYGGGMHKVSFSLEIET